MECEKLYSLYERKIKTGFLVLFFFSYKLYGFSHSIQIHPLYTGEAGWICMECEKLHSLYERKIKTGFLV